MSERSDGTRRDQRALNRGDVGDEDGSEKPRVFPDVDVKSIGFPAASFLYEMWWVAGLGEGRRTTRTQGMPANVIVKVRAQPLDKPTSRGHLTVCAQP